MTNDDPRPRHRSCANTPCRNAATHQTTANEGLCADCFDAWNAKSVRVRHDTDPAPRPAPEEGRRLPTDAAKRKAVPIYSGCIAYFPDALVAVAELSRISNEQHNPGEPLHWDRSKSGDELDALARHLVDAGTIDIDKVRHSTKVAWRALANLQKEIEADRGGARRGEARLGAAGQDEGDVGIGSDLEFADACVAASAAAGRPLGRPE